MTSGRRVVTVKRKISRIFFLHHWCGLIASVLLLVISLTGSILIFYDDIDPVLRQYTSHFALHFRLFYLVGQKHIENSKLRAVRGNVAEREISRLQSCASLILCVIGDAQARSVLSLCFVLIARA